MASLGLTRPLGGSVLGQRFRKIRVDSSKSNGSFAGIILGTLFIVAAVGLFEFGDSLYQEKPSATARKSKKSSDSKSKTASEIEQTISQHVQDTNKAIENDNFKRKVLTGLAGTASMPMVGLSRKHKDETLPLDSPEDDQPEGQKDLSGIGPGQQHVQSPKDVIDNELADLQMQKRIQAEMRAEYLRQYVENAKRHGWRVDLNPDGTVRQVTPIAPRQALPIDDPASIDGR